MKYKLLRINLEQQVMYAFSENFIIIIIITNFTRISETVHVIYARVVQIRDSTPLDNLQSVDVIFPSFPDNKLVEFLLCSFFSSTLFRIMTF